MSIETYNNDDSSVRVDSGEVEVGAGFSETLDQITNTIESLSRSMVEMEGKMEEGNRDMTREEARGLRAATQILLEKAMDAQNRFGEINEFTRQNIGNRIKTLVTANTGQYLQGNRVLAAVLDLLRVDWSLPNRDMEEFVKEKREEMRLEEEKRKKALEEDKRENKRVEDTPNDL